MSRTPFLLALVAGLATTQASAHPHLFVEVGVTVVFEDGKATGVKLDWAYDDFFTLLLLTDLGIDLDGDSVLTPEEEEILNAAVTTWPQDFDGDLEVLQGDAPVTLAGPADHGVSYDNGLITEVHTRPFSEPADSPITIRAYDSSYYVAYTLSGPVQIEGRTDCDVSVIPPDLNEAYSLVDELLYGRPASDVGPEEDFPEVGIAFAETITVTCAD
jgi:ABC-type uncharacterized transport system substrate-binding protein